MRYRQLSSLIFLSFLMLFSSQKGHANAAAPGFWGAGGTAAFSLLYEEDSSVFREIQMASELVSIDLYPGFAVVKGEYRMFNHSDTTVSIHVGYPVNTIYETESLHRQDIQGIRFDSLYALRAFTNGLPVELTARPGDSGNEYQESANWFVWEVSFTPGDTTFIEVYFIINTNEARITRGYTRKKYNAFVYLLESGAVWKQPIGEGEIRLRLNDGIKFKDIHGIAPGDFFKADRKAGLLQGTFAGLTPTPDNNIIISYAEALENFNFGQIISRNGELYASLDEFSDADLAGAAMEDHQFKDPSEVSSNGIFTWLLAFIVLFLRYLPWIAGVVVMIVLAYLFFRKRVTRH